MIVKSKYVKASRISAGKARSALGSHLKYLQYRERNEQKESRQGRYLFDRERDHIARKDVQAALMTEPAGDIYYHRMVLSPSDEEPVTDWHHWTRHVMGDLERHLQVELQWYAVVHQNTDHPHVHVVLSGTGIAQETGRAESVHLTPQEFTRLRESGREHSEYEHVRQIQEILKELEQFDRFEQTQEREHISMRQQMMFER